MQTRTPNKTKRRRIWLVVIAAVLVAVLVTHVRLNYKDGGTVNRRAVTWEYYNWHRMEFDYADSARGEIFRRQRVIHAGH